MAASLFRDRDQYNCSVCLDLMNDPVTIPCGHSYCRSCIKHYWDRDESRRARCPQCRQDFPTTPALNKNTMLAEILEMLRNTTLQGSPPSPPAQSSAQPGEVECDFCTDVKLRAVRSCLECRASYCETHLQPHYDFPALRKHKLVVAAEILTCPRHDKLLEAFCRTDNILICMSCVMDEHKGHDTVSSAAERDEKQVTLQANKHKFVEKRKEKEKELHELRKATESHTRSTQKAVEETELAFNSLVTSLEKCCSEVTERIRAQEAAYNDRAVELQEQLEIEIAMLMGQEDIMDKLIQTEDNVYFLQNFESMPSPSGDEESRARTLEPLISLSDVRNMISEFKEKLEIFSKQELENMFRKFHIKVGDRVRVKSSVNTPKFNWGCTVTHRSVGVITSISEEIVIVDFPEHKKWKGLLSEMECVTAADESGISAQQRRIKVGDRVRVKPSVTNPKLSWGRVTHQSVGVVKHLGGEDMTVDFPEHSSWIGVISEMELVP
ncbi:E3 ubiquitin/ISG15 ligase TRIM25-like isoform X1 [Ictalurus furcatus]|uniref:E3 ubiquitin/ISG15 ligase TRIM25-like isoform X1 n=1 Tax=Ictalurus furcatus TaxID=66913 RepID=UPI002350BA46|nr:E3 ubiquitin/ISG15 ligase TRIM25-like isoform X1 [Ictalurus furcatus]